MLCKATEVSLEPLIELRRQAFGETRRDAQEWLCEIIGLDNLLVLTQSPTGGQPPVPAALVGAVPTECAHRSGIWLCGLATAPSLQGRGVMGKLLPVCLRAFAASGNDFVVAAPHSTRAARMLARYQFEGRFPLRVVRKPIPRSIRAQAGFDNLTVRRLMDSRMRYQPACVTVPEPAMNAMVTRLYRRGLTIVSNQRGYGLFCLQNDELCFVELQADNDHSADILLQAAANRTGITKARLLLAENQALYLGEGKRCGYGMIRFLNRPFPVTDVYFRLLL